MLIFTNQSNNIYKAFIWADYPSLDCFSLCQTSHLCLQSLESQSQLPLALLPPLHHRKNSKSPQRIKLACRGGLLNQQQTSPTISRTLRSLFWMLCTAVSHLPWEHISNFKATITMRRPTHIRKSCYSAIFSACYDTVSFSSSLFCLCVKAEEVGCPFHTSMCGSSSSSSSTDSSGYLIMTSQRTW